MWLVNSVRKLGCSLLCSYKWLEGLRVCYELVTEC